MASETEYSGGTWTGKEVDSTHNTHEMASKPEYNGGAWSAQEVESFERAVHLVGWGNWKPISNYIVTRSNNQVKGFARNYKCKFPKKVEQMKTAKRAEKLAKIQTTAKAPKMSTKPVKKTSHAAARKSIAGNVVDLSVPIDAPVSVPAAAGAAAPQETKDYFAEQSQLRRNAEARNPFSPIHIPPRLAVARGAIVSPTVTVDAPTVEEAQGARASPFAVVDPEFDKMIANIGIQEIDEANAATRDQNGVSLGLIRVHEDKYRTFLEAVTAQVNWNVQGEYIVVHNNARRAVDIGTAMRSRFKKLLRQHAKEDWWKGDADSVTSRPGWGQPESVLVASNEAFVESIIALLVVMYETTEWRTPICPYPHSFKEVDEIISLVNKARDLWMRVKLSLSRGQFTLLGDACWNRRTSINELVLALNNYGDAVTNQFVEAGNHNVPV